MMNPKGPDPGQADVVIHVLLATFNGTGYLRAQWESLEAQEGVRLVLHVGDDASCDGTVDLLRKLDAGKQGAISEVRFMDAPPRRSATRSFLLLLAQALQDSSAGWFAYCDQDDIWLPGKLRTAFDALAKDGAGSGPMLYGGRTLAVDENNRERGLSRLFTKPPSFQNALAQNIMGGNTMLFNRAAARLVVQFTAEDVVTHDWLTYQVVSGAGGIVHYDPRPHVRYRQHGRNVIGSNLGWKGRWDRLVRMFRGEYREWNERNVRALQFHAPLLREESHEVLAAFDMARRAATPWARMAWLRRSGVFRQVPAEQAMFWIACLFRRI